MRFLAFHWSAVYLFKHKFHTREKASPFFFLIGWSVSVSDAWLWWTVILTLILWPCLDITVARTSLGSRMPLPTSMYYYHRVCIMWAAAAWAAFLLVIIFSSIWPSTTTPAFQLTYKLLGWSNFITYADSITMNSALTQPYHMDCRLPDLNLVCWQRTEFTVDWAPLNSMWCWESACCSFVARPYIKALLFFRIHQRLEVANWIHLTCR
jgi:hypothetical protein